MIPKNISGNFRDVFEDSKSKLLYSAYAAQNTAVDANKKNSELQPIMGKIKRAAEKGEFSTELLIWDSTLSRDYAQVIQTLEELSYNINIKEPKTSDEPIIITVSWAFSPNQEHNKIRWRI